MLRNIICIVSILLKILIAQVIITPVFADNYLYFVNELEIPISVNVFEDFDGFQRHTTVNVSPDNGNLTEEFEQCLRVSSWIDTAKQVIVYPEHAKITILGINQTFPPVKPETIKKYVPVSNIPKIITSYSNESLIWKNHKHEIDMLESGYDYHSNKFKRVTISCKNGEIIVTESEFYKK
ncbi:MAG: hypothetical protein HRT87_01440 [Legionellales bacterium]|nr:hypothetical protein [Legionellales bacterium]